MVLDSTSAHFQDELYYSANEYAEEDAKDEAAYQSYLQEMSEEEEEVVVHDEELYEDEFDYDDCYDYYYTTRLRRFHSPYLGFGYYNNYYTNSFWYSSNPYNCGVSIYYGYNFWNPWHIDPWYNYHFGWGHHYPHHHWGYHNHWSYWHGYHNGYYAYGHYPTYFNSYDNNSVYYGVRQNNNNRTPESFANRYVKEVKERPSRYDFVNTNKEIEKPVYSGDRSPSRDNFNRPSNQSSTPSKQENAWIHNAYKPSSNTHRPNNTAKPNTNYNRPSTDYNKPNNRPNSHVRNNSQSTSPSRNNNSYKPSSSPSRNSSSPSRNNSGSSRRPR